MRTLEERFQARVDRRGDAECWPWLGSKTKGRGTIWTGAKMMTAPRVALLLAGRPAPDNKPFACHTCDNPSCVNPAHLWWGSNRDNILDVRAKGRLAKQDLTHCKRGHPLSGDNLHITVGGTRSCKTCQTLHRRRHAQKKVIARAALKGHGL